MLYSSGTLVTPPASVILRSNLFCHREGRSPVAISGEAGVIAMQRLPRFARNDRKKEARNDERVSAIYLNEFMEEL
jgi:hypothetical protein